MTKGGFPSPTIPLILGCDHELAYTKSRRLAIGDYVLVPMQRRARKRHARNFLSINVNLYNMHLTLIHVLNVLTNRPLDIIACDKKMKTTNRCIVTFAFCERYVTFAIALFFTILERTIECR